jgi:hypothetical protein
MTKEQITNLKAISGKRIYSAAINADWMPIAESLRRDGLVRLVPGSGSGAMTLKWVDVELTDAGRTALAST